MQRYGKHIARPPCGKKTLKDSQSQHFCKVLRAFIHFYAALCLLKAGACRKIALFSKAAHQEGARP